MSLPTSRNRTYAVLSQVVSGDLNDLQDGIVATSNPSPFIPAASGRRLAGSNIALNASNHAAVTTGNDEAWGVPLSVSPGSIIAAVRTRVAFTLGDAETAKVSLYRFRDATTEEVASVAISANGGTPTDVGDAITPHTVEDGWQYWVVGEVNDIGASTDVVFQGFGYGYQVRAVP